MPLTFHVVTLKGASVRGVGSARAPKESEVWIGPVPMSCRLVAARSISGGLGDSQASQMENTRPAIRFGLLASTTDPSPTVRADGVSVSASSRDPADGCRSVASNEEMMIELYWKPG